MAIGPEKFEITNMNLVQPLDQSGVDLAKMNIAPIQTASVQTPAPAPLPGMEV